MKHRTLRHGIAAAGLGLLAVCSFGTGASAAALTVAPSSTQATGTVHTAGDPLTVRATPHLNGAVKGSVANGSTISIDCQTYGDSVSGTYGTTTVWDHVPAKSGYVSDAYVYTGSDGLVAPLCGGGATCSTSGLGDPNTCSAAVNWAKSHETTQYHSDYAGRCDHVMALAYGWSSSGSTSAHSHWLAIPSTYKHAGDSNVPAGGLAFFHGGSQGYGHVMISIGGGTFVSTDIGGSGTLTETTISTITSRWGEVYDGWAQPWFQINH